MPVRYPEFCAERALIFRITHQDNLEDILSSGLPSRNYADPQRAFRNIGNADLIEKRTSRFVPVHPNGTLSDYVPFYFTPRSMMLYNILTGVNVSKQPANEIVIIVSSVPHLIEQRTTFVFTDGHAYMRESNFYSNPSELGRIDWTIIGNSDFGRSGSDPGKSSRYQAELLVHRRVNVQDLLGFACFDRDAQRRYGAMIAAAGLDLKVPVKSEWYPG